MSVKSGCPQCSFSYAWDGTNCSYCRFQAPTTNVAVDPPKEEDVVATLVHQACYGEIEPHLDAYQRAEDPAQKLAMMEPHHYRRFAKNALQSLAELTYKLMEYIYERQTEAGGRDHPEVAELRPHSSFLGEISSRLRKCDGPFVNALSHFEQLLMGFRQKLQAAGGRAERQGAGWGFLGGFVGGMLLGPLGGIAAACCASYFGGSLIEKELHRDVEQLHLAFVAMLGEYENLMSELRSVCGQMIDTYHHTVESTVQRAIYGSAPKKLPF
ncbi:MAG: hypothetical protein RMJ56_17540 [Gemmataceae bacterium]|nr:hypothetical protein [Gemmata sp.]MDW8199401.1 hypothetical protein [Gemmataceae bacterium]